MIADIARRGLSHPNAVAFVKRAVTSQGDAPEGVEVPVWGGVLLYVTFMVAAVSISLVSPLVCPPDLIRHKAERAD
jgi:hypothetical protein